MLSSISQVSTSTYWCLTFLLFFTPILYFELNYKFFNSCVEAILRLCLELIIVLYTKFFEISLKEFIWIVFGTQYFIRSYTDPTKKQGESHLVLPIILIVDPETGRSRCRVRETREHQKRSATGSPPYLADNSRMDNHR